VELITGLHLNGIFLALLTNIGLGRKLMKVANTLAYYAKVTIIAIKSFIVQPPAVSD
jgi:hypothetical protein